jgi:hypothetical protein
MILAISFSSSEIVSEGILTARNFLAEGNSRFTSPTGIPFSGKKSMTINSSEKIPNKLRNVVMGLISFSDFDLFLMLFIFEEVFNIDG